MNNTGIGFIVWDDGWACSDDVMFDVEKDPVPGDNGKIILVETNTLKFNFIFEGRNKVTKDLKVLCLFKTPERKVGFRGVVRGKSGNLTIVNLHTKIENINEIIAKIKSIKP